MGKITIENRDKMPPRGQGKLNKTVKETVLAVFNELQEDPKVKLVAWAKDEPTEFYKIAAKLIPTEITGTVKTIIHVKENNE
jgi:hypothetical protein